MAHMWWLFHQKQRLNRSITYGSMDVKENGVSTGLRLEFEEWQDKEEGFLLPKVWVQVKGIGKKWREFLNLWAVGSILGSTQMVDMKTTRRNNFGRILVAVLDPKLLPAHLDVVIGDRYFELKFKYENKGVDENGEEVDFKFGDGEDNGNQEMDHDGAKENNGSARDPKRARNNKEVETNATHPTENSRQHKDIPAANNEVLETKIRSMATEIMDLAFDKVIQECCDKVLAEDDDMLEDGAVEDVTMEEGQDVFGVKANDVRARAKQGNQPLGLGTGELVTLVTGTLSGTAATTLLHQDVTPATLASRATAGAALPEVVRAAAAIKDAPTAMPRSSPRLTGAADACVMERAKKRTAWKNLDMGEGNDLSFTSFSTHKTASKINDLGVVLGNNDLEIEDSIFSLKLLEQQRMSFVPTSEVNEGEYKSDFESNGNNEDLENLTLGHLCGNLMEEVMDEDSDHLSCDFQTIFKKNKSKKNKNPKFKVVRKSKKMVK